MTALTRPGTGTVAGGSGGAPTGIQPSAQTPPPAPAQATATPRRGTPRSVRRLRRLQVIAVALVVAFGALVVAGLAVQSSAAGHASASLAQYNRLTEARVQALQVQQAANTWALTPTAAVRAEVTSNLTTLATSLADASAVSEDRDTIAPLTAALVNYSMTLQDALNAKGTDSAALLAKADSALSADLLKPLGEAAAAAGDRVSSDLTANWLYWVIGGFVLAGGGLIAVQVALARASHRYLNPGVALGLVAALASVTVLAVTAGSATTAATSFSSTTRAELDAAATARTQLNQARADELLMIALQGGGASYRTRWNDAYSDARKAVQTISTRAKALSELTAYAEAHGEVVEAADHADWAGARSLLLGDGAAATAFDEAASSLAALASDAGGPAAESVGSVGEGVVVAIAGVVLLTLAGAALAVWGVARRIEEYR